MGLKGVKINDIAYSLDYNYLENKPVIPTKLSDLRNDSNFITAAALYSINNRLTYLENNAAFKSAEGVNF